MATYTVDTIADTVDPEDGSLSLREALALADVDITTPDRIEFAPEVQGGTIVLAGSQLTVNSDVIIDGRSGVTVDADGKSRVLLVQGGTEILPNDLTLAHMTITGGRTTGDDGGGAGIHADFLGTSLTLDQVTVSGNSMEARSSYGGGISGQFVTLINSTVSGNSITGGFYASGGGIYSIGGDVTLTNSTVSGNSVMGEEYARAGGIRADYAKLTNSTVSGNSTAAGTIADTSGIAADTSAIANSIIADSIGLAHAVLSNGHNIFGSVVSGPSPGDRLNVSPSLVFAAIDHTTGGGLLADNGGPTQTIALRDAPDNPALAGADPTDTPATDQRGEARPQPTGTDPDIGAFELNQTTVPLNEIVGTSRGEFLSGTAGADLIRGLGGGDRLWGRPGDDILFGDAGKDVLAGKAGIDQMTGGEGADRFLFRHVSDAPATGPSYDEVLDFSRVQHDKIDLRPIDADRSIQGNQEFGFIGDDPFTHAGQLRAEATTDGDFLVSGNTDRDLDADLAFVVRSGAVQLEAGDFLL